MAAIAERIGAPFAVLRKIRHGDRNVEVALSDLSAWRGRQAVLVDDIASSGRTLIEAARQLPQQGFARPVVAVVHAIFAGVAYQQLAPLCGRIVSTDAVRHQSNAIALAPLIAQALATDTEAATSLVRHRRPPEPLDDIDPTTGADSFTATSTL